MLTLKTNKQIKNIYIHTFNKIKYKFKNQKVIEGLYYI